MKETKENTLNFSSSPDRAGFLVSDEGDKYYLKVKLKDQMFKELLAQEVAEILNIKHAEYIACLYNGYKALISKSYIKTGYNYIKGSDLMKTYFKGTKKELLYDKTINSKIKIKESQDLYIIWQAMEQEFKHYPNYDYLIISFMDKLIEMVLFDILIANWDRASRNWCIEYNETEFKLVDIFDHDYSFDPCGGYDDYKVALSVGQCLYENNCDALKNLINETSGNILEKFESFCSKVNPDNINEFIGNVMSKHDIIFNQSDIFETYYHFTANYKSLQNAIKEIKSSKTDKTKKLFWRSKSKW